MNQPLMTFLIDRVHAAVREVSRRWPLAPIHEIDIALFTAIYLMYAHTKPERASTRFAEACAIQLVTHAATEEQAHLLVHEMWKKRQESEPEKPR